MDMKRQPRVSWSKGMFLSSHHLQAQDQFVEDEFRFRTSVGRFANWGLTELEIAEPEIENGRFRLLRCAGIFPDGLSFSFPAGEKPPEGESFQNVFPTELKKLNVYLTVPDFQTEAENISKADGHALRFVAADIEFTDIADGQKENIQVTRPNLRLAFGTSEPRGCSSIQIAQIERSSVGVRLNPDFIPPCVTINISPSLMDGLLPTHIEALALANTRFSPTRSEQTEYLAEFSESDIRRFWVLDIANRALPELKHIQSIRHVHPEDLYRLLLRVAGALCTFSLEIGPLDFPEYDHKNLGSCFKELGEKIERMLKSIVYPPPKFIPIGLTQMDDGGWAGAIEPLTLERDGKRAEISLFDDAEFYIALRARASSVAIVRFVETEKKLKICGSNVYEDVRDRALEGTPLRHMSRPPRGLPGRVGSEYFKVVTTGFAWGDVLDTSQVRVIVAPGLDEPMVEMFALLK